MKGIMVILSFNIGLRKDENDVEIKRGRVWKRTRLL